MTHGPHLTDGQLRAHLDAELAAADARHLAGCPHCQARLAELAARQTALAARFAALAPPADDPALAARPALARFQRRFQPQEKVSMFKSLFRQTLRPLWTTLAVAAVLAGALAFEPVRAWAGQFLGLFRVQQVTVLPVDTTGLEALAGDQALANQISQMMANSVTVLREPGEPQAAADAAAASQLAGFAVRLPANRTDLAQLQVQQGGAFEFTVERGLAQDLLNEMGRTDLTLPATLDGAVISVDIPAGVSAAYGDCPAPNAEGSRARRYAQCLIFTQMPSPSIATPPDLDVAELAAIGLQLTGMTAEQAREYTAAVDWTSTLVIPIPRNGAEYHPVTVDGVTGYLIQRPADDAPQFALVWTKAGVLYAVGGLGSNSAVALDLANALP
ncbi:MAG: hypothetical protein JNK29_02185 [Anaerolineales bacterium]|nr:hypothetical protein [Anaerolineales bacterium]